ncbi:PorP/SprF family type IX secretion system membrane protein [Mongoliitalea lutea]|uniref:Type IX secretion system membrane protein, PorP/SprF family n=1 Tax=Mongoliitalea lutea TaxID=849756 RepID=A0A8J3G6P2_9BACT|nr:PorP/SprF family type IX secretion system membrane protein [Mongoliitalea lutea]GHB49828.1 hypothetical protein GCM10008106_33330 [Mongoliitalea lutea]
MKKLFLLILLIGISQYTYAQSRKYISQFSHLQQYYNPGLTANEGSMMRGFVRNQYAGWEGTPLTYFLSAEIDINQVRNRNEVDVMGKNAISITLLNDSYGPFTETELILGYATRIQLSEFTNLRLGLGVNYNTVRLDGNNLNTEQLGDPTVSQFAGNFADMQIVDFNIGMALTHKSYYISYGFHNVNQGQLSKGDIFMDKKPLVGVLLAGFREHLSPSMLLASNVMWRTQVDLPDNVELNLKVLFKDTFWLGLGHRINYANSAHLGFIFDKFRLGYVYELPLNNSFLLPNTTHEFMLAYSIFGTKKGLIW